jgi:hypothetical protein
MPERRFNVKVFLLLVGLFLLLAVCIYYYWGKVSIGSLPAFAPANINCAYVQNPGPVPEIVQNSAYKAFSDSGMQGYLNMGADGEYHCGTFGVMQVNFTFYLQVDNLSDQEAMATLAAKAQQLAHNNIQGYNMGRINIWFVTGQDCFWDNEKNVCGPNQPHVRP